MSDENRPETVLQQGVRRCIPALILSAILSLFVTLGYLALPVYMINVFDRVMSSRSENTLIMLSLLLVLVLAIWAVLNHIRDRVHIALSGWLAERLGLESLEAMVAESVRGRNRQSETLQDVNTLQRFVGGQALPTAFEVMWTPLFFLVLFIIHWVLGTIAVVGALILVGVGVANEWATGRLFKEANKATSETINTTARGTRNAEVIEGMGMQRALAARWHRANQHALELQRKANARASVFSSLAQMLRLLLSAAVLAAAAALAIWGSLTFGVVIGAKFIAMRAFAPYMRVVQSWRQWVGARTAYHRVNRVLAEAGPARAAAALPAPEGPLEVDRVSFVPPGFNDPVLRAVSFTVASGEAVAIAGPSASGKSTLARLMLGVLKPTSGAVRLDGHDVYSWDRNSFGQYVGYLPQGIELFDATVRDNIARLQDAPTDQVVAAAKAAGAHELIGRLPYGYDTPVGNTGFMLTGGQRQRLALARALFGDPHLLILDEPDAHLDEAAQGDLHRAVAAAKARGAAVVVVSHRETVLSAMDRVILLQEGQVVQTGYRNDVPSPARAQRPQRRTAQGAAE